MHQVPPSILQLSRQLAIWYKIQDMTEEYDSRCVGVEGRLGTKVCRSGTVVPWSVDS